jgi:hypothetical protein
MLVGYTLIGSSGKRAEHWVHFIGTLYNNELSHRCKHFTGPDEDAPTAKKVHLAWDTRIMELESGKVEKWQGSAYAVWEAHFGPVSVDPSTAKANAKRRQCEQLKRNSNKRQKTGTSSPMRGTSSLIPSVEKPDVTDNLDDEELAVLFYDFTKPFSEMGYTRLAQLLQRKTERSEAPPVDLLAEMRQKAKSYAMSKPDLIWSDPKYEEWLKSTSSSNEDREEKKNEKEKGKEVVTGPMRPGEAYAALLPTLRNVRATLREFFEKYPKQKD